MRFWLGTDNPAWLKRTSVPLFVSRVRLDRYKDTPVPLGPWALDSGGYSELSRHGAWTISPRQYADAVARYRDRMPTLAWAAQQDWMCEKNVLAMTKLTVRDHQCRTVENYQMLRHLAPDLPWVPVLQGQTYDDYRRHQDQWRDAGILLQTLPLVGLGSVCRRQDVNDVASLIRELDHDGVRVHAFGFKLTGLATLARHLASSDSMAWSYRARRNKGGPMLATCSHKTCKHCLPWALAWRDKVLKVIAKNTHQPQQHRFWA